MPDQTNPTGISSVSRLLGDRLRAVLVLGCVLALGAGAVARPRIHVDDSVPSSGDGSTWGTALKTLQEGLTAVSGPGTWELWVAEGTYTVTGQTTPFVFPSAGEVKMYGGFVSGQTALSERDPLLNQSIITGDVNGFSTLFDTNNDDDAGEVMVVSDAVTTSVIDGFIFRYARQRLMRVDSGSQLKVTNNVFEGVFADPGVNAQGVSITGTFTAPVFGRNTVRYVTGGDVLTSAATGSNGPNGSNGADGNPGQSGGAGNPGQVGGNGTVGGTATGILVAGGATPTIYANRVNAVRGGLGGGGGTGGAGGRGGNGGAGTTPGAAGGSGGVGGVGGSGGRGGNGGDAFGIAYNTISLSPEIAMNLVYDVRGGSGGFGGIAGLGGSGGNGGSGAAATGTGGAGGNAGNGGAGGARGNGGDAGKAYFIATDLQSATRNIRGNTMANGVLGSNGPSGAGGGGGAPGLPGAGGTGTTPGANGATGSLGATGASGTAGALGTFSGILASGTGAVSALNNIIMVPTSGGAVSVATSTGPSVTVDHAVVSTLVSSGNVSLGSRAAVGNPAFVNPNGADGIPSTDDDDFAPGPGSAAWDAGANSAAPLDALDEDNDQATNDPSPKDFEGKARFTDMPVADTGVGAAPIVDIGAIEADPTPPSVVTIQPSASPIFNPPAFFFVVFDRPVTGPAPSDALLGSTGGIDTTGVEVSGFENLWSYQVDFVGDSGLISFDLQDSDKIVSRFGVPLNGVGASLIPGASVSVEVQQLTIVDFFNEFPHRLPGQTVQFGIGFSETASGVSGGAFRLVESGVTGSAITNVFSQDGQNYTIEITLGALLPGATFGSVRLDLIDDDTISSQLTGALLNGPGSSTINGPSVTVSGDCNANGEPDASDLNSGASQDCNSNGVPDECDISGSLPDQSFGPLPYLRQSDSPFPLSGLGTTAFIETAEDGLLNTPGVTTNGATVCGCGGINDSVDADDGTVDGSGTSGSSIFAGDGAGGILFTFNTGAFGRLPQYAGVVFTDGGLGGNVTFEARDGAGNPIGSFPAYTADGSNGGTTAEDRFFGIVHAAGIGSIRIRCTGGGIEADHLQYGVFAGSSQDNNSNGIPDECEGPAGTVYSVNQSWRVTGSTPPAGWNTQTAFDDSDAAGWIAPFPQGSDAQVGQYVWSAPGDTGGSSTTWMRKKVNLLSVPTIATLKASADDDVTVFVNGQQVASDANCLSGPLLSTDVTALLVPGENLIAAVATDCGCCGRGVGVRLEFSGGAADCNENGIDDLTEIASSAVPDTNGNGVPDPCELVQGTPGDCNNNGINDASDINLGVSTDCNFNNIPDECEALKSPVYFSGFEGGVGPEWSVGNSATTPSGRAFLGELANSTAVLSLSNLPAHTALAVDFDLFIIRSWDGNSSPGEILGVRLDGVTHRAWTFSNVVGGSQSYPRTFGTASVPARDGAAEFESLGYGAAPFGDSVYRVRLLLPHSAPDAQIAWFAEHLEGISNESWGLDNVKVSVIAPGTGDCNADGRPDACGEPLADGTAITPYVTFAQGPFAGIAAKWLYLDTFESGSISAPGVSVAGAAVFGPNSFIDSVDEDNGSIDGNGNSGARSLYSSSGDATIYFNSLDLGGAPQFAGIAFTDLSFGPRDVTFDVYDTGGTLVETRTDNLGAIATNGDTSEDRLLWAVHRGGIGWIRVFAAGTDLELDHLQFGRFAFQDCNANGFEDACDIASGEPDQNGDGVPDTCLSGAGPRPFPFHGPSRVSLGVTPFGSGTANMLVADLNRDEQNDAVVIANSSANASVFVRASQTELMFARYDIGLSAPARNVVASDFDRDGSIDLVFSTRSGAAQRLNVVYSSLSRGGPFDNDGLIGGSGATILAMTLIDVDRDGYEDIAGVDASGNLVVFINTSFPGSISFGDESVALPGLGSPDFAAIARTSILSGGNDLVVAMGENAGGGRLIRLENSGDAFDVLGVDSTHAYTCVASANIDADGVAEILAGHTGGLKVFDSAGNFEQDLEGFNAVEVKLGDIDRNGFVDALVLNEDGTCTQLVNDHGFFAPRSTGTLTGDPLIAIGLGDVEPDGDLDLWATADGDESLFVVPSLLPHRQQGFFSTSGVAASGDAPSSMAVGDFNGDGTPDIAAASFFDDTVKWARFDHGQFRFVQTTIVGPGNDPVADGPSAVAVADFNLDGRDDVAVAGILNSRLVVRFNPGNSGAWAGATVDSVATGIGSLAVADFNADGAPDIAAGLATPGTVRLYLNRANGIAGVFEPVTLPAVFPGVRSIAVGDLNSDGRPDIVAACPAGNLLRLALQTDPILRSERNVLIPEFNVSSSIALNGANVVTAGDFNGDGRDDIASSSPLISVAIVYPQTVFGEFAGGAALQAPQSVSSMFRADVNADGNADLVMVGRQADSVWVARGDGAGSFQVSSSFAQLESASAVVAADFDRDGNTDLASASFATDKVFWTRNFAASLGAYGVGQLSSIFDGSADVVGSVYMYSSAFEGDVGARYARFTAFFQDRVHQFNQPPPVPLSASQVNALITRVRVYHDANTSLTVDAGDVLLGELNGPFTLPAGVLTFALQNVESAYVDPGEAKTFLVEFRAASSASQQGVNTMAAYVDLTGETIRDTVFNEGYPPEYPGAYSLGQIAFVPDLAMRRARCESDLNYDGATTTADLVMFLGRFGTRVMPSQDGDLNADGVVTTPDLVRLLSGFGRDCP